MQEVVIGLMFLLVLIAAFTFWLRMLVDCATEESDQGNTKIVWILIIIFTHLLGALVYWFVRRPQRRYAEETPPSYKRA